MYLIDPPRNGDCGSYLMGHALNWEIQSVKEKLKSIDQKPMLGGGIYMQGEQLTILVLEVLKINLTILVHGHGYTVVQVKRVEFDYPLPPQAAFVDLCL
jgi:hypothetical protein